MTITPRITSHVRHACVNGAARASKESTARVKTTWGDPESDIVWVSLQKPSVAHTHAAPENTAGAETADKDHEKRL